MNKNKILIVRLSSIGDIIQCLAVPRHLKTKFPSAEVHWLVRKDNEELLLNNPYVTKTIAFDRKAGILGWIRLAVSLRRENYSHIYDAHNKLRSLIATGVLAFRLSPPKIIVRSKERWRRALVFYFQMKFLHRTFRGIDTYLMPLERWGIKNDKKGSELNLPEATIKSAGEQLKNLPWPDPGAPIVAIAPATAWEKKNWPEVYWKELLELLLKNTNFNFLVLGGPKDSICSRLSEINPSRIKSLHGKLSLTESAACITYSKTLVAADTGLLHMAEALGKNVIGITGPSAWGHTYREQSKTLTQNYWCQPCSKDGSGPCFRRPYKKCLWDIKPQRAFDEIVQNYY